MNCLVVFASRTGNTRRLAEAMAAALRSRGTAVVRSIDDAPAAIPAGTDLLLVGGPTEAHGVTPAMVAFLDRLDAPSLRGVAAAAFDTRVTWPRILSGAAAPGIAGRLREKGARVMTDGESFLVTMKPELVSGELERAATWAVGIADIIERLPAARRA
jgi:flavodoxin